MANIPCTATTRTGKPCRAWAVADTEPPICAAHGGTGKRPGAPTKNQNALKHGQFASTPDTPLTITAIITDLQTKQATISAFIQKQMGAETDKTDIEDLVRLLQLHGQNASRLGRLLRDQRALSGEAADGIAGAIGAALDELSTQWGIDL